MKRGKVIQFDWDYIGAKDDDENVSICLTWAERQILLTTLDYVGWLTRWYSPTGATIDQDQIDEWRDSIAGKLMFGVCPVDCDDVIACVIAALGGTGTLAEALDDWLNDQIQTDQDTIDNIQHPGAGDGQNPLVTTVGLTDCDEDELYGFALQIVQLMNTMILDAFEILEVLTNGIEFLAGLSEVIPSMVTQTLDIINYFQEALVENYEANYSVALETQYACDLFCIALSPGHECTLNWWDIYTYFMTKFGAELADATLSDICGAIAAGEWEGSEICDACMAILANVLYHGGSWANYSLQFIQTYLPSLTNDPDSDWETNCTDCIWLFEADFTVDNGGFEKTTDFLVGAGQGEYVASSGWHSTAQNNGDGGDDYSTAFAIKHDLSCASRITNITLVYNLVNSGNWQGSANTDHVFVRNGVSNELLTRNAETDTSGSGKSWYSPMSEETQAGEFVIRFVAGRWFQDTSPGGSVTLKSIEVRGRGDNPFD